MITIGAILHSVPKQAVLASLALTYHGEGEDPAGYSSMWDTLLAMQPALTDVSCVLSRGGNDDVDVSGLESGSDLRLAIEFTPWAEWLSMPVIVQPELGDMSLVEQLCHILYELSWGGYTEAAQQGMVALIQERIEEFRKT